MKKTYISPNTLVVELRCKNCILADSLQMFSSTTVEDSNGGWVKEENPPINDVNVWDDEW